MSIEGKIVFLHLLTTPLATPFGLYKAGIATLAEEMQISTRKYSKGFQNGIEMDLFRYNSRTRVVYIPNFFRYNLLPPNSNNLKSWCKILAEIPDCEEKEDFCLCFSKALESEKKWLFDLFEEWKKADFKSLATGVRNSCFEQVLETADGNFRNRNSNSKKRKYKKKSFSQGTGVANSTPIVEQTSCSTTTKKIKIIFKYWQEILYHPNAILDNKRKRIIEKALKLYGGNIEPLKHSILGCSRSKWHIGNNPDGKKYDDIELILRDASHIEKFIHIAEHPENLKSIDDIIIDKITGTYNEK
jgi:hypothetical protein